MYSWFLEFAKFPLLDISVYVFLLILAKLCFFFKTVLCKWESRENSMYFKHWQQNISSLHVLLPLNFQPDFK